MYDIYNSACYEHGILDTGFSVFPVCVCLSVTLRLPGLWIMRQDAPETSARTPISYIGKLRGYNFHWNKSCVFVFAIAENLLPSGMNISVKEHIANICLKGTGDTQHATFDTWNLTHDMWHLIPDTWHIICLPFSLSSCTFRYWCHYPRMSIDSVSDVCWFFYFFFLKFF